MSLRGSLRVVWKLISMRYQEGTRPNVTSGFRKKAATRPTSHTWMCPHAVTTSPPGLELIKPTDRGC